MFQFSRFAPFLVSRLHREGFTYSEIFGLMVICTYPKLIAAYHVLHRLQEPRHPPCALNYFVTHYIYWCNVCFLSICQRTVFNLMIWWFGNLIITSFKSQFEIVDCGESNPLSIPIRETSKPLIFNPVFNRTVRITLNSWLSLFIVENNGFEPLTLCVQGRCSSQLS